MRGTYSWFVFIIIVLYKNNYRSEYLLRSTINSFTLKQPCNRGVSLNFSWKYHSKRISLFEMRETFAVKWELERRNCRCLVGIHIYCICFRETIDSVSRDLPGTCGIFSRDRKIRPIKIRTRRTISGMPVCWIIRGPGEFQSIKRSILRTSDRVSEVSRWFLRKIRNSTIANCENVSYRD